MTRLDIRLLGPPEVYYDDRLLDFSTRKALALLAYLVVEGDRQPREKLAALFWPESAPDRARASLRNCLLRLRQSLPGDYLLSDRETIAFDFDTPYRLDLDHIEEAASGSLEESLSLVRGDFLDGFAVDNAPAFDDWIGLQRAHWQRRLNACFDQLSQQQLATGRRRQAQETVSHWLVHDPLNETAYRRLMRIQLASDERTAALHTYQHCRDVLAAQLGVEPSPETEALADRVRRHGQPMGRPGQAAQSSRRSAPAFPQFAAGPLVGRAEEFETLVQCYYQAQEDGLRLVALVGEAGMGKSRLMQEFLSWADAQGSDVLHGRSYESGRQLPYGPLIEALRPRLERINAPEDLLADVWLAELSRLFPELRDRYPDLEPPAQDEPAARARLFEAVTRLVGALAEEGQSTALVLAVDDVQWSDATTLELLEYACRRWQDSASPVLLLLAVRAEALHPLAAAQESRVAKWLAGLERSIPVTTCSLAPLSQAATSQYLAAFGGKAEGSFARWLHRQTQGQPFYLVEILQDLVERGLLATIESEADGGSGIRWLPPEERHLPQATAVPERVRRTIVSRLGRLDAPAFALLVASAVLAQGFTYERLCQVAGVDEIEGLPALDELLRSGLLRENPGDADAAYIFAHDKIRDVTYSEAGDARRRLFHRRALAALAEADAPAAQLARHALAAGQTDAACRYSLAAGDEALALFAAQDAIAHYEQARTLLAEGGSPPPDPRRLYLSLGRAHELAGDYDQALAVYDELQQIAQAQADKPLELAALMARTTVYAAPTQHYDPESVAVLSEQALPLARELGDHAAEAKIFWNLLLINIFTGDMEAAIDAGETSLAIARAHGLRQRMAYALHDLHRPYLATGQMGKALTVIQEAQRLWRALDNQAMLADNLVVLGSFQAVGGEYDDALALCQEALDLSRQIDNLWNRSFSQFTMTPVLFDRGEYGQALEMGEAAIELGKQAGFMVPSVMSAYILAWVYGDLGDVDRGMHWAAYSLAQAEKMSDSLRTGHHSALAYLHLLQGDLAAAAEAVRAGWMHFNPGLNDFGLALLPIADCQVQLAQGAPQAALDPIERLLALERERGVGLFRSEILLQKGRALLALARVDAAAEVLQQARQRARAMGARRPLWRILAILAEIAQRQGEREEAQRLQQEAAEHIYAMARSIKDPDLRASFLNTAAVQAVLAAG